MNDFSPAVMKTLLKQAGLRATPARIATLTMLSQSSKPLSHAEVSDELKNLGVDKTTVYRNLNDLVGANLLRRAELGDHIWRFELANHHDEACSPHPHFVCIDCGDVFCIDEKYLQARDFQLENQTVTVKEVLVRGHCNNC